MIILVTVEESSLKIIFEKYTILKLVKTLSFNQKFLFLL